MVSKPEISLHVWNNNCKLNEKPQFADHPKPRPHELIEKLEQVQLITTLDLTDSDNLMVIFSSPRGHRQYLVLHFGLQGAMRRRARIQPQQCQPDTTGDTLPPILNQEQPPETARDKSCYCKTNNKDYIGMCLPGAAEEKTHLSVEGSTRHQMASSWAWVIYDLDKGHQHVDSRWFLSL